MTTSRRRHLHAVPGLLRQVPEPRCSLAVQAVMAGPQKVRVTGTTPQASGRGYGHLCLRVGRVLLHLEDRDSLHAWQHALHQAREPGRQRTPPGAATLAVPAGPAAVREPGGGAALGCLPLLLTRHRGAAADDRLRLVVAVGRRSSPASHAVRSGGQVRADSGRSRSQRSTSTLDAASQ